MLLLNLLNMLELPIHETGWCSITLVVRSLTSIAVDHVCLTVIDG